MLVDIVNMLLGMAHDILIVFGYLVIAVGCVYMWITFFVLKNRKWKYTTKNK